VHRAWISYIGLVVSLGGPVLVALVFPCSATQFDLAKLARRWAFALAILALVVFAERLPLSSIGLRRPT
jgi:hypothetical protein